MLESREKKYCFVSEIALTQSKMSNKEITLREKSTGQRTAIGDTWGPILNFKGQFCGASLAALTFKLSVSCDLTWRLMKLSIHNGNEVKGLVTDVPFCLEGRLTCHLIDLNVCIGFFTGSVYGCSPLPPNRPCSSKALLAVFINCR